MRPGAGIVAMAVVIAACGGGSDAAPSTSAPPTTVRPSTVATDDAPAAPAYTLTECTSTPTVDFALLCDAHRRVLEHHLQPPSAAELAAAAALGIEQAPTVDDPPEVTDPIRCQVPGPKFESVCEALAERLAAGDTDTPAAIQAAVSGMFRFALDPFSSYLPPDLSRRYAELASGYVPELGMVLAGERPSGDACSPLGGDCRLLVVAVFELSPAEEAGVVAGDRITSIDAGRVVGLGLTEALAQLAGAPGTSVTVTVERDSQTLQKELVRQDVRLDPVEADVLDSGIVHLRFNEFSQVASQILGQALQSPEVQQAEGLILDLRDNPGGLLLAAQAVASQFLGDGLVMVENRREGRAEWPVVEGGLAVDGPPLAVLVNGGSASASEVVAGVLQERGRATVVGQPTFGKAWVQETFGAADDGRLVITVSRWTTPGGLDVAPDGVQPDVVVEDPPDTPGDPILAEGVEVLGG